MMKRHLLAVIIVFTFGLMTACGANQNSVALESESKKESTLSEADEVTPTETPEPTATPIPESKYDFACKRELTEYTLYYLFDFDEMTGLDYVTTDTSAMDIGISGDIQNGVEIYLNDGTFYGTLTKQGGSKVVLIDYNGFDWDYEEIPVSEAEAVVPME